VFVSRWMILARPVDGSSCMTLLASLFANNTVPLSPAMGPSTLFPSHDQTTFHDCPAAHAGNRSCGWEDRIRRRCVRRLAGAGYREGRRRILALREHVLQSGILPALHAAAARK